MKNTYSPVDLQFRLMFLHCHLNILFMFLLNCLPLSYLLLQVLYIFYFEAFLWIDVWQISFSNLWTGLFLLNNIFKLVKIPTLTLFLYLHFLSPLSPTINPRINVCIFMMEKKEVNFFPYWYTVKPEAFIENFFYFTILKVLP